MNSLSGTDRKVKEEEQLVERLIADQKTSDNLLVVKKLRKVFGSFEAVKDVSFTVQNNECFGLLGEFWLFSLLNLTLLRRKMFFSF
jgi:ABC-type glutathione transport system ATPase component